MNLVILGSYNGMVFYSTPITRFAQSPACFALPLHSRPACHPIWGYSALSCFTLPVIELPPEVANGMTVLPEKSYFSKNALTGRGHKSPPYRITEEYYVVIFQIECLPTQCRTWIFIRHFYRTTACFVIPIKVCRSVGYSQVIRYSLPLTAWAMAPAIFSVVPVQEK